MKIIFLQNYEVQDGSGTRYESGQIVALGEASVQHFISRGAAREATADDLKPAKKDKPSKGTKKEDDGKEKSEADSKKAGE